MRLVFSQDAEIEACLSCAAICNHCASSCTQEEDVKMMARCIQLDVECAALCYAAAQLMSMGSSHAKDICNICADACEACAAECARHDNEHCRECAEKSSACATMCRSMANSHGHRRAAIRQLKFAGG